MDDRIVCLLLLLFPNVPTAGVVALAPSLRAPTAALAPSDGRGARPTALDELERRLREARPDDRRRAVRALAELGGRPAWSLVVEALADPEPEVADEAQLALARLDEAALIAGLYGRAGLRGKDELVRLRAAEALGRLREGVDGAALLRAVDRRQPEVARAALWSIERAARGRRLAADRDDLARELLEVVERRGDPAVRGAALLAACAVDRGVLRDPRDPVGEALGDRAPELRCAASIAAVDQPHPAGWRAALRLASDRSPSVRAAAVDLLEALGSRDAAALLVERLRVEERTRIRWSLVAALRRLSGTRYRLDPRPWEQWVAGLTDDWVPGADGRAEAPLGDRSRAFAGLPLVSDRIAFLIDFSGSLWQGRVGSRTRKEVAIAELSKALEALPASAKFNVVPYTGEPHPWRDELVPASPKNVRAALEFLRGCDASGRGNYYGAAMLALADPDVDTVVAYTDGVPTGGTRWNLDLMVDLLLERNRFRRVAFDTVLVDARPAQTRRWERLARESGGRVASVAGR